MNAEPSKNDDEKPKPAVNRVYGRGFFDGLKAAGIENPETFMNHARLAQRESHLSGIAKRVLEAVPHNEQWDITKIISELARNGTRPEHHIVMGCLNTLLGDGLVREPARGVFSRVMVEVRTKPRIHLIPPKDEPMTTEAPQANEPPPSPAEPMDKLAEVAASARKIAESVSLLAKQIEDAAIEVELRVQKINADTDKLRQLQTLLKQLGT